MGLGGDVFLWHARQWLAWRRPVSEQLRARAKLAHGRLGGTRGQHLRHVDSWSVCTANPFTLSKSDLPGSADLTDPNEHPVVFFQLGSLDSLARVFSTVYSRGSVGQAQALESLESLESHVVF